MPELSTTPIKSTSYSHKELLLWFAGAFILFIPTIVKVVVLAERNPNREDAFVMVVTGTALAFAILFRVVFRKYPVQALLDEVYAHATIKAGKLKRDDSSPRSSNDSFEISSGTGSDDSERYLSVLAYNSRQLASVTFSRANIFLVIGY